MALSVGDGRERKLLGPKSVSVSLPRYLAFQFASPPSLYKGWPFNFFLRLIKLTRYARSTRLISERGTRYAAHHHQFSTAKRRSAHAHPLPPPSAAKFHAVQLAANHSTWPIYYPTIVTGLIRRLIRPRPRNYGLFNRGFSSAMHDFTIGRRFEDIEQFIELSKDTKGFESKSAKFDFREIG